MKFSEIDVETAKTYLVSATDDDNAEIEIYIAAAKSYVMKYTAMTEEEIRENEHVVMPTLMLISSFFGNKSVEMSNKMNIIYSNLLTIDKVHSL